jgi:hypothetical protein
MNPFSFGIFIIVAFVFGFLFTVGIINSIQCGNYAPGEGPAACALP